MPLLALLSAARRDGEPSRSLTFVMGLPLADGVFATLVVAGALDTSLGILQVGLLVFGGAATAALLLASEADRRADALRVFRVAAVVVPVAALEAAVAPALATLVDTETFRPFAGLVLLAVAARVASAHVTRYLPAPGLVVLLGAVLSFQPTAVALRPDLGAALHGVAAALVGVGFALGVVLAAPHLRGLLDAGRFRFGSAVALGTMGASVAGLVSASSPLPLAALVVAALLAVDPDGEVVGTGDAGPGGPPQADGGDETPDR